MTMYGVPTVVPAHMHDNGLVTDEMMSNIKELARNAIARKGDILEGTEDLQISEKCHKDHDLEDVRPHYHYNFYAEVGG